MSTQKGNDKKKPQRYQNRTAFKVTFNETYQKMADNAPLDRLCAPCKGVLEWKIQYGKYKVPTCIGKCVKCDQKNVYKAYRTLCDVCTDELGVCGKCIDLVEPNEDDEEEAETKLNPTERKAMESYMDGLRERSRRTVLRKIESGNINAMSQTLIDEVRWSGKQECFINCETREMLEGLQFKLNYLDNEDDALWDDVDEDEEEEDDDEEEEEEEEEEKKEKGSKQKGDKKESKQKGEKKESKQKEEKVASKSHKINQKINDEYQQCLDVMSDGSRDLDKYYRTQKNFKFYFKIKNYPDEEENEDENEQ